MKRVVEIEAQRQCQLWGRKYRAGDVVKVKYVGPGSLTEWLGEHLGEGGPWGWGGYTSASIERDFRWVEDR
jgi:hypothetical protein